MAYDLQKVMQRVRLVSPAGEIFKPSNRILCALDAIAAHTLHDAPELGACCAASTLGHRGMGKSRRTFFRAVAEAESCGLAWRSNPVAKPGIRFQSQIYFMSMRLIEAAATGFRGEPLLFQAPFCPPGKPGDPTELKSAKAKAQHAKRRLENAQAVSEHKKPPKEKMMEKSYQQECQFGTLEVHGTRPRPKAQAQGIPKAALVSAPQGFSPSPKGAGGAGLPLPDEGHSGKEVDRKNFLPSLLAFMAFFKDEELELDFQARLQTGKRGARLWAKLGGDPKHAFCPASEAHDRLISIEDHLAGRMKKKRLEGVLHVVGDHPVLLVDDLDATKLKTLETWWQGQMSAIETSPGNFQAFLDSGKRLTSLQRKSCQVALALQFGGDPNATGGVQMHRYPGSMNYKNGGAFCTRLVSVRLASTGDPDSQVEGLLKATSAAQRSCAGVPGEIPQVEQHGQHVESVENDPSRAAFVYAIRGLRAGKVPQVLALEIAQKFNPSGKHTRGQDGGMAWAMRTLANAGVKALDMPKGWLSVTPKSPRVTEHQTGKALN